MNIKEVFEKRPDGFSINLDTNEFLEIGSASGYLVSITHNKVNPEYLESQYQAIRKAAHLINRRPVYVGGWRNAAGDSYLDVTIKVDGLLEALALAKAFNQECVFSILDGNTINQPETIGQILNAIQ